jgi:hypothetical protein
LEVRSLNVTQETGRFAAARPLDRFAQQFTQYLVDCIFVEYGVSANSHQYLKDIKVLNCTEKFWAWLLDTKASKMIDGSPNEYDTPQSRDSISGLSLPAIGRHRTTHQLTYIPKQAREDWLSNLFPTTLAHDLAPFDALIFIYKTDRWAIQVTRAIAAEVKSKEIEYAKWLTVAAAPYSVVAHECLHLVLRLVGGTMPTWNPTCTADPVDDLYFNYLEQITLPKFVQLYLQPPEPQADEIDL